jgi:hypothetical protein
MALRVIKGLDGWEIKSWDAAAHRFNTKLGAREFFFKGGFHQ